MGDAILTESPEQTEKFSVDDSVVKRREARRRKILNNAKSRLEKLNGRIATNNIQDGELLLSSTAEECKYSKNYKYSDPEVEPSINNITAGPPFENSYNLPHLLTDDFNELFMNDSNLTKTQHHLKHHRFLLNNSLHIILISLITCVGTFLWPINLISTCGIFTLSSIYVIIDVLYIKQQQPSSPIINILMTLLGLRTQFLNTITNVLANIQYVMADFGLFIFSFCSLSYLLILYDKRFETLIKIE